MLFARSHETDAFHFLFILFLLFIRNSICLFLLFSDSKFEGCQSSSRVFDQASRLQSWMGGHLLQLCMLSSHVLTNPELFGNWFLRKIRLKMNSVLESMTLTKQLWGVWMYLQFTNNFYFFKAITANDKIEIEPNTRLLNIEPFKTNFAKIDQIIVSLLSNKFNLFEIWLYYNTKAWGQRNPKTQRKCFQTEGSLAKIKIFDENNSFIGILWYILIL